MKAGEIKRAVDIPDTRTKCRRALIFVAGFVLLTALLAIFFIWIYRESFINNPRLGLREIHVSSSGFWNKHEQDIFRISGLKKNNNLFSINLKSVKAKLKSVPSIEDARVVRILPDTLLVNITERMPRAVLNYPKSRWVVDENGIVMERSKSMAVNINLPVITGVPQKYLKGGEILPELKAPLELVTKMLRSYPDMEMLLISASDPEQLDFYVRFRNGRTYRVVMPSNNRGVEYMLNALQSAIIHSYSIGDNRSTYNLSFDGQVVIN